MCVRSVAVNLFGGRFRYLASTHVTSNVEGGKEKVSDGVEKTTYRIFVVFIKKSSNRSKLESTL